MTRGMTLASLAAAPALQILLMLGLVSAVWVESDLYRYCALLLLLQAILAYAKAPDRPAIGPMGGLCIAWAAFVLLRNLAVWWLAPETIGGSAEGIYLFPLIYPTIGYAFYLAWQRMEAIGWWFLVISLVALAASLDPQALLSGDRAPLLFHSNPIHASVGSGLIALVAICFGLFLARPGLRRPASQLAGIGLCILVAAFCFVGIAGALSKGVWLALIGALPILIAMMFTERTQARHWLLLAIVLVAAAVPSTVFYPEISALVTPHIRTALVFAERAVEMDDPTLVVDRLIASGNVPFSLNERLMIWMNGWEIWRENVVFGTGVAWEYLWDETRYATVGYQLMHNGFLEIAVRYGLVGLAFYTVLAVWSLKQAFACRARGLIPSSALILYVTASGFFALTMLTNSNNRLAIGESFLLVAAGFGFCCFYRLQAAIRDPSRTHCAATP
jgi:O-antigen ligase